MRKTKNNKTDSVQLTKQVLDLPRIVGKQNDAIVSREIMNKRTGTVTLFAFDKGQGLSEHTAPFDAMLYVLEGEAEVRISGQAFVLKKGRMIIMPGGEPHAVKAVQKFKMLLVMIKS